MTKAKTRRYSGLISPLSYFIDILIINFIASYFITIYLYKEFEIKHFFVLSILWILISVFNRFYYIYRYTNILKIISLLFNQVLLFTLSLFCFSGIFPKLE
jgi:putative colanic acid biosynthesis UDP-glucose lipid carrier transferase